MNYNISVLRIVHDTIVDGFGLRTAIYGAGCEHECYDCHNVESWGIENGTIMNIEDIYNEIIVNPLSNITFTGGDPMFQAEAFCELAKRIKTESSKTIWCYTGYLFESILHDNDYKTELLKQIDVLVDGKYINKLKSHQSLFRGSSNQRIIDVQKSIKRGDIVCLYV